MPTCTRNGVAECDRSWREGASSKTSITPEDLVALYRPFHRSGDEPRFERCGRIPADRMLNSARAADKAG